MTAYEVRISDWSSDVCSSDLRLAERAGPDPDIVVEPLAVLRKAMRVALASGQQRRAAGTAERIADKALREDRAILCDTVDIQRRRQLRHRRAIGRDRLIGTVVRHAVDDVRTRGWLRPRPCPIGEGERE